MVAAPAGVEIEMAELLYRSFGRGGWPAPASPSGAAVAPFPDLADHLADLIVRRRAGAPAVLGIAGGVAAGKTTVAEMLAGLLRTRPSGPEVAVVATDGFLLTNSELEARHLAARKGFPESFDAGAMIRFLAEFRATGGGRVPRYSHLAYDVVANQWTTLSGVDLVILEGINVLQVPPTFPLPSDLLDASVYLHAREDDLRRWFRARMGALVRAAADDPSFLLPRPGRVG